MIEVIWPLSVMSCNRDTVLGGKNLIGLRTFIQEVLKRSKTSYSTLQVALYYLILIKPFIPRQDFTMEQPEDSHACRAMQCGRRMFLAALILASKYLQDRNYSARAWSKISGLKVHEINTNEMAFVTAVNWNLHVPEPVFQRWTDVVLKYSASAHLSSAMRSCPNAANTWKSIVPKLTPKLDNLDLPETPSKPLTSKTPDPWPTTDYKEGNGAAVFKIDYELPIRTLPLIPTTSAAKFSSPCLSSNEQTPTAMYTVPRVLEPTPQMGSTPMGLPPLPSLGPLPTPQMTPQSRNFSTPAVSATGLCPLKSAMSFAMKQVQSTCMARTVLDQWRSNHCDSFPISSRRSSLARSVSSFSSPESMISDTMSRSSRSSSISSVSSSTCALPQPRLAMQATRRCANMQLPGIKEHCRSFIRSPMLIDDPVWEGYSSSPDSYANAPNEYFHKPSKYHMQSQHHTRMHDHSENEAAEGLRDLALSRGQPDYMIKPVTRKRERQCSMDADASVQHDVRALMSSHSFSDLTRGRIRCEDDGTVLTDSKLADSFLLSQNVKLPGLNLFNYQRSVFTRDEGGRKRMCCVEEKGPIQGPGMWSGIL
ncbi:MAG: hypothetical protein MMC33_009944 [Icmadophila ericetorum]|nr:hypothetical protein [Icmadophila ericetorum]